MWLKYVIRQGDYLAKLAHRFGFDAGTVWGDPRNSELRSLRGDPNVLHPGDVLWIPEDEDPPLPLSRGGEMVHRERRYGDIGRAQVRRASVAQALAMLRALAEKAA